MASSHAFSLGAALEPMEAQLAAPGALLQIGLHLGAEQRTKKKQERGKASKAKVKGASRHTADDRLPTDDWPTGLNFMMATLNTKAVRRSKGDITRVLPVALAHNLRSGNEAHRHRRPIDAERTYLNEVLVGGSDPGQVGDAAWQALMSAGFTASRRDAIVGIEYVMQPPEGWDLPEFYRECLAWCRSRSLHLLSATVHRDQKRPHLHIVCLPIVEGRAVSGAELSSKANRLESQRTSFMGHMRRRFGLRSDRPPPRAGVKDLQSVDASPGEGSAVTGPHTPRGAADLFAQRPHTPGQVVNLIPRQPHDPSPEDIASSRQLPNVERAADAGVEPRHAPDLLLRNVLHPSSARRSAVVDAVPRPPGLTCGACENQTRAKICVEAKAAGLNDDDSIEFTDMHPADYATRCPAFRQRPVATLPP